MGTIAGVLESRNSKKPISSEQMKKLFDSDELGSLNFSRLLLSLRLRERSRRLKFRLLSKQHSHFPSESIVVRMKIYLKKKSETLQQFTRKKLSFYFRNVRLAH